MTGNAEQQGSKLDILTHMLAIAALGAGVYGYYYFEEQSVLYATLAVVGGLIGFLVLEYATGFGKSASSYIKAANTERRKVVWPTRQETLRTLLAVVVVVTLVSIFLWICDKLAGVGVEFSLG